MDWTQEADRISESEQENGQVLVIIPIYKEYDIVLAHLDLLAKQTTHAFDVLLILNALSDEKALLAKMQNRSYPFAIHIIKRHEENGSAGGYYAGQKFALDEGYQYLVMGDADCMPVDERLLEQLIARKEDGWVEPKVRFLDLQTGQAASSSETLHSIVFYNLLSCDLLRHTGLYYMPIYMGGDDVDFCQRMKKAKPGGPVQIQEYCMHPPDQYFSPVKYFAYSANFIIFNGTWKDIDFTRLAVSIGIGLNAAGSLVFCPPWGRRLAWRFLGVVARGQWGRAAWRSLQSGFDAKGVSRAELEAQKVEFVDLELRKDESDTAYRRLKRDLPKVLRKNIAIEKSHGNYKAVLMAALAKKAYFRLNENEYVLLAKNENRPAHALKLLVFALLAPPLAVLMIIARIIGKIRKPRTDGFGL